MRGYFAIGAERISKPMNLGNLLRSAHAFGAKFFFTIGAASQGVRSPLRHVQGAGASARLPMGNRQRDGFAAQMQARRRRADRGRDRSAELPPSAARRLRARAGAWRAFERTFVALRLCHQNSVGFLYQRCDGWGDCHVRPGARLGKFADRMAARPRPAIRQAAWARRGETVLP